MRPWEGILGRGPGGNCSSAALLNPPLVTATLESYLRPSTRKGKDDVFEKAVPDNDDPFFR